MHRRTTYADVVSTVALVLALGGGGAAVAGSLGKNTVGSKQLKAGAVRTVDLADGAVTGAKVDERTLSTVPDADLLDGQDSSAFARAAALPSVHQGARGAQRTLTASYVTVAQAGFTAPADGFARIDVQALFESGETGTWVDVVIAEGATVLTGDQYWDVGDDDGNFDLHQSTSIVVPVTAGAHTYSLRLRESSVATTFSEVYAPYVTVTWFPRGSVG